MRMKKALLIFGLILIAYLIGRVHQNKLSAERYADQDKKQRLAWKETITQYLKSHCGEVQEVSVQSGEWNIVLKIPGEKPKNFSKSFVVQDNRKALATQKPSGGSFIESLNVEENTVSWRHEGTGYLPYAEFIGVLDPTGKRIHGFVFNWGICEKRIGTWEMTLKESANKKVENSE